MRLETIIILRNKKKFILYILLISIALILLNLLFLTKNYINIYINKIIENKDINRIFSININDDNDKEKIEEIIHNVKNELEYSYIIYDNIYLNYNDNEVVLDNILSLNDESKRKAFATNDEVVVSSGFLERHNLMIGDKFDLYIKDDYISLTIIDSIELNDYRSVYMNSDMIDIIVSKLSLNMRQYIIKANNTDNIVNIKKQFNNQNYNLSLYNSSGREEMDLYKSFGGIITKIIYLICLIVIAILYWIIKDIYLSERKNIAIKKLIGYSNIKCLIEMLYKGLLYIIVSVTMVFIIITLSYYILVYFTSDYVLVNYFDYNKLLSNYISCFIIFILIYLISFLLNIKKVLKLNLVRELTVE